MDRDLVRTAGLALLGVVALGLTATTLPTARQPAQGGSGGSSGPGQGTGGLPPGPTDPLPQLLDLPFLAELVTALLVVTLLVVLWVLYTNRRAAFHLAVLTIVAGIVAVLILQLASPTVPSPAGSTNVSGMSNVSGVGGGETSTTTSPSLVSFLLVAAVGAVLLGTAVAANRRRGDDSDEERDRDDDTPGSVAAVGRAAGRAADRIEETDEADNEVYRAWREMTDHLDVDRPETSTAREFERAAVAAGMERSDVAELTDLFERVRYDDYEVGETDEQRAVELLRRIESRYAEDEP